MLIKKGVLKNFINFTKKTRGGGGGGGGGVKLQV